MANDPKEPKKPGWFAAIGGMTSSLTKQAVWLTLQMISTHPHIITMCAKRMVMDEGLEWDNLKPFEQNIWRGRATSVFDCLRTLI